jgi:hypothetical protein
MEYVKWSLRFLMRDGRWSVFLELRMEARKRVTNQDMEYWYMGSMEPRLEMQKKRMDECTATGVYLAHTDIGRRDKRCKKLSTNGATYYQANQVTACRRESVQEGKRAGGKGGAGTGRAYPARVASICSSVLDAISCFSWISVARTLEEFSTAPWGVAQGSDDHQGTTPHMELQENK